MDLQGGQGEKGADRTILASVANFHHAWTIITFPITTSDNPTVSEAMQATPPEVQLWEEAINAALENLRSKETRKAVGKTAKSTRKSPTKNASLTHVVLRIKRDENGVTVHFRARVVAGGIFQVSGRDFSALYAPVVDFTLVCLTLVIALHVGGMSGS